MKCPAGNITTNQQSSPNCLLALDQAIPKTGEMNDHKQNKSVFKYRIKQVLLYQVHYKQDKGVSACLVNNKIWYKVMSENMH